MSRLSRGASSTALTTHAVLYSVPFHIMSTPSSTETAHTAVLEAIRTARSQSETTAAASFPGASTRLCTTLATRPAP